jgi:type III secretion system low calcium response chaperone LcrH/SycD
LTSPANPPLPAASFDEVTRQLLHHIGTGGRLGDMMGFEERELEIMYALGHTMYTQRRFADAAQVFGFLLAHDHTERRYMKALAASLQMGEDYAGAIQLHTLANFMDMTDPEPALRLCECLIGLDRRHEAAEGLAMVIGLCEDDTRAPLRARAQALLDLLAPRPASPTTEHTP